MTYLEPVALFLSLWRYVKGPGAEIPFIGTRANYLHTNTDSSHDIIARSEIYLSVVKPGEANGEAFNTADNARPVSWVERWPVMTGYFGLKGAPPVEPAESEFSLNKWLRKYTECFRLATFPAQEWWQDHQDDYKRMCSEYGLRAREISPESWIFMLYGGHSLLCRNRELSLQKIRSVGFVEEQPVGEGHFVGFDRMVAAKILPPRSVMQGGAK